MAKNDSGNDEKRLQEAQQYWDQAAASFDDEPDHGLRDESIRAAWSGLVKGWLPDIRASILDIGCGTGSLSVILAGFGQQVRGIDLSPAMITLARAKAARLGVGVDFQVMDAAFPQLPAQEFDLVICRHLLWALPEPGQVLQRWAGLLKPQGRLVLVEGFWSTGAGLHAGQVTEMLPAVFSAVSVENLSDNASLWGGWVSDERYAIIADREI